MFAFYRTRILAKTAGMATNKAIGPYWAAPLQPSVEQVSQNSVRMYDGVLVLRHSSLRALMFSQKHDREMTYLSFTRIVAGSRKEQTNKKYISRLKLLAKVYLLYDEFEIVLEMIINQNVTIDWYILRKKNVYKWWWLVMRIDMCTWYCADTIT